jgi:hypothetical protein
MIRLSTLAICLTVLFSINSASFAEVSHNGLEIDSLISEYYQAKYDNKDQSDCPPDLGRCADKVCDLMGSFACRTRSDLDEVLVKCRGNFGASCISTACSKLGHFGCDTKDEVFNITNACRGNINGSCLKYVCNRLGHFDCDTAEEITPILRRCAGN